jgi:hypothetical protein
MKKQIIAGLFCLLMIAAAILQVERATHAAGIVAGQSAHTMASPDSIKWAPMGQGIEGAVLSGNPQKEGEQFVLRLKLRDGTKVQPHWHPIDEHLTVISGTFYMGTGEKFDEGAAHPMTVGMYALMPKETRHFAWVKGETVVQIHGVGPFKTFWVNPPDSAKKP